MADWQPASDVADICRFYRQRIFDLMHPSAAPAPDVQTRPEGDSADNGNGEFRSGFPASQAATAISPDASGGAGRHVRPSRLDAGDLDTADLVLAFHSPGLWPSTTQ